MAKRDEGPVALPIAAPVTPRRCRVAHAWLSTPMHQLLEIEAEHRHIHTDELLAQIAERVLGGGLTAALLDN